MGLNPLTFTEKVVGDFLKYQLTAYPFTDPGLNDQMRELLSVEAVRRTPLLKGPYVSLSRAFRTGIAVEEVGEGVLHPFMENLRQHPSAADDVLGSHMTLRISISNLGQISASKESVEDDPRRVVQFVSFP